MEGIPVKSVHWCAKCYQYFGIDDVNVSVLPKTGRGSWLGERMSFKHDFRISPIYPNSLFNYDIDKVADWWSKSEIPSCDVNVNHLKSKPNKLTKLMYPSDQLTETSLEAEPEVEASDSTV